MSAEQPCSGNCPDTEELLRLIGGALPDERQSTCERHLGECSECQSKIEHLAEDGTNLSKLVERVHEAEAPATSAYWPALNALAGAAPQVAAAAGVATPPGGTTPTPSKRIRELSLSFLEPPTDGAYLGRLLHFDVMRIVGRGGMGIVLEAFDSRLRRNVALKVLDPELSEDEVARQRFCREARAAASITHENVVAVHQVERAAEGTVPYMVMQFVAGESLEQRLEREPQLPLREIVRIGMQVAHGLAAAHAQNLIHRDVKPGNVLLESPHDRVKLTDFGLARVEDDVKLTRTGYVSGTPLYMAPEQARGEEPDPRSDLFSLGAMLYEMCAGRPPFQGNSALAILKQITEIKPAPLRQHNPRVPEWLEFTIDKLLAKKPADRIQTAAQVAELFEFQWALMKASSEDVPTVCEVEERKRAVRTRWIVGAVAAAFLLVGLFGGKYLARHHGATDGSPTAPAVATPTTASPEPLAVLAANSGAVWSVEFDAAGKTLAMAVEDGSIRLWDLATKSVRTTINAHRGTAWLARYSPDGKRLATAGDDGLMKLWDPERSEPVAVFKHDNTVRGIAFSRDGQTLYAGDRGGGLRVWKIDAAEPTLKADYPAAVYAVALSPDGETLAAAGSDKIVILWNAKTLTQKLPLTGHNGPIYGLAFHPDGRRLASVGWDKTVRIWDVAAGTQLKSWTAHDGDVWSVAYSPDGSRLVTGGTDNAVKVWNSETGELAAEFHPAAPGTTFHAVGISRDGRQVSGGGRDGAARVWRLEE